MDPFHPSYIKDFESWHDDHGSFFIEFKEIQEAMADEMKAGLNLLIQLTSPSKQLRYKIHYSQSSKTIRAEIKYCPESVSKQLEDFLDRCDPERIKSIIKENQE